LGFGPVLGFVFYLLKVLVVVAILTVLRTVMARLRIDQMLNFCWQIVAPVAFLQIMIDLLVKGWVNP
jgi:NADH-quinone oxidoreductase subunit H